MGKIKLDNRLEAIFKELSEKAYNPEFHNYDYKYTNQVVRKHFEALLCDGKTAVIDESKCNKHIVNTCALCGSTDLFKFKLEHIKCRSCNARFEHGC